MVELVTKAFQLLLYKEILFWRKTIYGGSTDHMKASEAALSFHLLPFCALSCRQGSLPPSLPYSFGPPHACPYHPSDGKVIETHSHKTDSKNSELNNKTL